MNEDTTTTPEESDGPGPSESASAPDAPSAPDALSAPEVAAVPDTPPAAAPAAPRPAAPRPAAPRPGAPRPGPTPGARGPATPASPPVTRPAATDPTRFGRVHDDGTVWLVTVDGERQVGSWQAGEPAEGLAHFGRRFDDMATEVALLERRVDSGSGDARGAQEAAQTIADTLPTAAVVGDVDALAVRVQALLGRTAEAAATAKAAKAAARAEQAARKETLAAEAEVIGAESTQWKASGDRLREILEEWKTIRGVDRRSDDALWKRYSKAREAFNRRRGGHFAELDRERVTARTRKEELVAAAQELSTSTDFGPTAGKLRDLMTEWKAAGRAPREADDVLWQQFKAAQDVFYAARNAVASERDAELEVNAEAKKVLLTEAERIDPSGDLGRAKAALRSVQERWDAAGMVPRAQVQDMEARMRAVETRVRDADESRWRRTDPEAEARAAQFSERVAAFEEQAVKARTAGKEKRAVEAEAQAAQWREWAAAAASAVADR